MSESTDSGRQNVVYVKIEVNNYWIELAIPLDKFKNPIDLDLERYIRPAICILATEVPL